VKNLLKNRKIATVNPYRIVSCVFLALLAVRMVRIGFSECEQPLRALSEWFEP
jgi:hypothetical protein